MSKNLFLLSLGVLLIGVIGCHPDKTTENQEKKTVATMPSVPDFNADSAYAFVQSQVDFGPRIPNTAAQEKCAAWLYNKLKEYTPNVEYQNATVTAYDGTQLKCHNIIASINPEKKTKIALFSHWDTRPWADEDTSLKYKDKHFDGAGDGPSGVAIILEIARQLVKNKPDIGVNIVFLDAEDYGVSGNENSYCLGTQYWGQHLDKSKYYADYGILLDMVGAPDSRFLYEGVSARYAQNVLDKVWKQASLNGYSHFFIPSQTSGITDDHTYINEMAQLPTIDIIDYDGSRPHGFAYYWHTHYDDMKLIDRKTLKAVGQTLLGVIFSEGAH